MVLVGLYLGLDLDVDWLWFVGHGWDVKCIDWHPSKGLLASGSKDNLAKLWDPKTGKSLSTL